MSQADAMLRGLLLALRMRHARVELQWTPTVVQEEALRAYMAKHALDCDCAVCEAYASAESVEEGIQAAVVMLYAGKAFPGLREVK